MTPKEKNNAKYRRLGVIHKYEADYNLILKLFWPKKSIQLNEPRDTLEKINGEQDKNIIQTKQYFCKK